MECALIIRGEEVVRVLWREALFVHPFGGSLAAEDDEGFELIRVEKGAFFGVGCWDADEVMESWAWVVHVGGFGGGVVVEEEDVCAGGALWVERREVSHCFAS